MWFYLCWICCWDIDLCSYQKIIIKIALQYHEKQPQTCWKKLCCGHAHGIIVVTLRMLPSDFVVTLQLNPMTIGGEEIGECLLFSYREGVWVEIHFKWHFMLFYNDNGLFLDIKIPLLIYNEPSIMTRPFIWKIIYIFQLHLFIEIDLQY